jgi:hypothetical protein
LANFLQNAINMARHFALSDFTGGRFGEPVTPFIALPQQVVQTWRYEGRHPTAPRDSQKLAADIFMLTLQSNCCMKLQAIHLAASRSHAGEHQRKNALGILIHAQGWKSATFFTSEAERRLVPSRSIPRSIWRRTK